MVKTDFPRVFSIFLGHSQINRKPSGLFAQRKGQAFVEFAMMVPLMLFLIVVGIILALTINSKLTVTNASHEAGRVASVTQNTDKIKKVAEQDVIQGGLQYHYGILTTFDPNKDIQIQRNADGTVTVTIGYKQPTIVPMIGSLLGNPNFWGTYIPVQSSATFLDETKLTQDATW